jgi:hypothetical protein
MKHLALILGILMLFSVGVMAQKGDVKGGTSIEPGAITVTAPSEGWDGCGSDFYVYAYWETVGPVVDDAQHWEQTSYIPHPNPAITKIEVIPGGYRLTIENAYSVKYKKRIFIKLMGTGATGTPDLGSIQGINVGAAQDTSIGGASGIIPVFNSGDWSIVIRGLIWPQPQVVVVDVMVPGSPVLSGAWVSECCNYQSSQDVSVPSITTWGAIILVALLLISGLFIMRRRRVTA